jgi:hypothetical protein
MGFDAMEAGGGRRALNSEVSMVPMIDLMICCISFLLLTAVWSAWGRLEAEIQGQKTSRCGACGEARRAELHVTVRDEATFSLAWREGGSVLRARDLPRPPRPQGSRYPDLAREIRREWASRPASLHGVERPVAAVLHVDSRERFDEMAAVMDAIQSPRLSSEDRRSSPAFYVRLAN